MRQQRSMGERIALLTGTHVVVAIILTAIYEFFAWLDPDTPADPLTFIAFSFYGMWALSEWRSTRYKDDPDRDRINDMRGGAV